jgi:hypothetical protein
MIAIIPKSAGEPNAGGGLGDIVPPEFERKYTSRCICKCTCM